MANIFNSFEHLKKKEPKVEEKPAEESQVEEEKKEEAKVEEEIKNKETDVQTEEEVKVVAEADQ